ncbi:MAG: P-II family nitrogen regulator [Clostridiales Family XIII bacterium]|jgi:nitrogen regulatory protein P-II 1|nr:P-II family nitrogen regulator [Clostridiales Family XIII bacterium]
MIIKVEAIVREDKLDDVIDALTNAEVNGITVSQIMGHGVQKGYTELVRGQEVIVTLSPKIKFEIVVSSEEWEKKVISAIKAAAFTGEVGDGKIFSYDLRGALRIRTGETDYDALNP